MAETARYDRIGIGYDTTRRADPHLTDRLVSLLGARPGDRVLDVACGSGNYTLALADRGLRMTGVDRSPRMIAAAREKSAALDWALSDAAALPLADGSVDGVICTLAMHHFDDRLAALREMCRVLRRGRLVVFTASREQMHGYWLNAYFPVAMARSIEQMPDTRQMADAMRAAGFQRVREEPYTIRPDLRDFFLYSGKHRPEIYLDPGVRAGISTFSYLADAAEIEGGCTRLASDIDSGRIHEVMRSFDNSLGDYLFMAAEA